MCRSMNDPHHRRCAVTAHTRALANQNRKFSRQTKNIVLGNLEKQSPAAVAALKSLPPSALPAFLLAVNATNPGILDSAREGRRLPGVHNMITEDVRDRTSPEGARENALKFDQYAVERIQKAVALYDIDTTHLQSREQELAQIRLGAVQAGIFDHRDPESLSPEEKSNREWFYHSVNSSDLGALTEVQQRISDQFYEAHLKNVKPELTAREFNSDVYHAISKSQGKATVADLVPAGGSREVADGVKIHDTGDGKALVQVDGMLLPIFSDQRVGDVVKSLPKVGDLDFSKEDSPLGQSLVSAKYLNENNKTGANHARALRREIIRRSLGSGTHDTRLEDGKSSTFGLSNVGKVGLSQQQALAPRTEGYLLGKHIAAKKAADEAVLNSDLKAAGITPASKGDPRTPLGAKLSKVSPYKGTMSKEDRASSEKVGWMPNGSANIGKYGSVSNTISPNFKAKGKKAPGYYDESTSKKVSENPVSLSRSANEVVRSGRNPETVDSSALIARAQLEDAFRERRRAAAWGTYVTDPKALVTNVTVPSGKDAREWVEQVFPVDGVSSTTGYTTAYNGNNAPPVKNKAKTVRVRMVTEQGEVISSDDRSVVDHRTRFVTSHIAEEKGVITVYQVSENLLVDTLNQK